MSHRLHELGIRVVRNDAVEVDDAAPEVGGIGIVPFHFVGETVGRLCDFYTEIHLDLDIVVVEAVLELDTGRLLVLPCFERYLITAVDEKI